MSQLRSAVCEAPLPLPDAFDELYRTLGGRLYRHALAICGDRAQAEDVVQEAFVRVWRRRGRLRETERLEGYLYRTTRNLALDHHRSSKSKAKAVAGVAALLRPGRDGDGPDAERITAALFELPDAQREVVFLKIYEGETFPVIAERTGAPLGTVHSRYRYAMERLRELLKEASHER